MRSLALILSLCLFTSLAFPAATFAEQKAGDFGLGLEVGTTDSITGKYFFDEHNALDFGVGIVNGPWTVIYADYQYHLPGLFGTGTEFGRETSGYVGGGLGAAFWHDHTDCRHWDCGTDSGGTALYLRAMFGAEWKPRKPPIGVFLEIGPSFTITPFTSAALEAGLGIRYYF